MLSALEIKMARVATGEDILNLRKCAAKHHINVFAHWGKSYVSVCQGAGKNYLMT